MVSYPSGTKVMYRANPHTSTETLGEIIKDCGGGVFAILVSNYDSNGGWSLGLQENCYHIDDPRVKEFSAAFWEDGSGVFRLAPITEQLEARLAAIEAKLSPTEAIAPKRTWKQRSIAEQSEAPTE